MITGNVVPTAMSGFTWNAQRMPRVEAGLLAYLAPCRVLGSLARLPGSLGEGPHGFVLQVARADHRHLDVARPATDDHAAVGLGTLHGERLRIVGTRARGARGRAH